MSRELEIIRRRLAARKAQLDADVPNHGYDSGFAMAAQAGGIEEAIVMIDEATKGRKYKIDPSPGVERRKQKPRGNRKGHLGSDAGSEAT